MVNGRSERHTHKWEKSSEAHRSTKYNQNDDNARERERGRQRVSEKKSSAIPIEAVISE